MDDKSRNPSWNAAKGLLKTPNLSMRSLLNLMVADALTENLCSGFGYKISPLSVITWSSTLFFQFSLQ